MGMTPRFQVTVNVLPAITASATPESPGNSKPADSILKATSMPPRPRTMNPRPTAPRRLAGQKDRLILEREARAAGYCLIAGVDEVGTAAWAGPMVAAAVILPEDFDPTGLRDGKKKNFKSRLTAYERIRSGAVAIGLAQVSPQEIDDLGFHASHMRLLRDSVAALATQPDFVLVDAFDIPELPIPQKAIPRGDDLSASIAAASIIAKVECDRILDAADAAYPAYGFRDNKGYAGAKDSHHRKALERFGPSEIHRRSVKPVRDWLVRHGDIS